MSLRRAFSHEESGMEAVGHILLKQSISSPLVEEDKGGGVIRKLTPILTFPHSAKILADPSSGGKGGRKFHYLLVVIFFFFVSVSPLIAEEIPERIDGTVASVDPKNRLLRVDFEHPATLEHSQMEFQVATEAGFKDFKKLNDLKPGDLVSLDYLDSGAFLKAVYVIHIPQEKTYFTPQEIAGALVKIKGNQKNPNETQKD